MDIERYFEETLTRDNLSGENRSSTGKSESAPDSISGSDDNASSGFECNICLDSVQDPVVTLCGHIYCWPCIYKWLHFQTTSSESQDQKQQQCPVCKAEVSQDSLIPLYGWGLTAKISDSKAPHLGIVVPKRPLGPVDAPRSHSNPLFARQFHDTYYSQQGSYPAAPMVSPGSRAASLFHPEIGVFGDMVYARIFGNSITNIYTYPNIYNLVGNTSPRMRRYVMQADESLSRISFFLLCCVLLCLVLF